jgi:arylsulfatase A-like enzyme
VDSWSAAGESTAGGPAVKTSSHTVAARFFLIVPFAAGLACASIAGAADPLRPNIVVFLADDLGWSDCSVSGNNDARTPNMTRVARDGMTLTHAFVASPSCAPSRAALLTGLTPARNGAMFNHTSPDKEFKTWPTYFHELGYETAAIGKVAHYATVKSYGFEHFSHFKYHEDDCVSAAVEWLRKRADARPLCLFVGTNWPHVPWPKPGQFDGSTPVPPSLVDTAETREWMTRYASAVQLADRDLGIVYDAAFKALGDNTLFIFTSDHGAQLPFGKWNCYDAGLRTPLVAVWPGRIKGGSQSNAMVSWVDLLPTSLHAAGGNPPPPGMASQQLSGQSFLDVLLGKQTQHRDHIFATHSGDGRMNDYPIRALRSRDWKYIRNLRPDSEHHTHIDQASGEDGRNYWSSWIKKAEADPTAAAVVQRYFRRPAEELYDLRVDPWELHNLANDPAHVDQLAQFRGQLDDQMRLEDDRGLETEEARRPKPRNEAKTPEGKARPNIILVLADDFGWGDIACYGGQVPTPSLDAMAREGTRFTQFYVASPICSPSRAGLLTGQFPARWRLTSYLQTRKGNRECEQADYLDPQAPSLARTMRSSGYATAHVGKWHLGGGRDVTDAPKFAAYGYNAGFGTYESPEPHEEITATGWIWSTNDRVPRWQRTEWMVDRTLAFLDSHEDQACFVNLWLDDTHTPWVPEADELNGDKPKAGTGKRNLRRVLTEMDRQIGRLIDELKARRERRETLVLLLGDNGPLPTFDQTRTAGLRGSKLSLYEGGIRVPLIAWWPGRVPANRVNDQTVVAAVDLFPTLCAIGACALPKGVQFDGEDLSKTLLGETQFRSKPLYWEYGRNETSFAYPKEAHHRSPKLAVRDGRWKLLVNSDGSDAQLYDLLQDPFETADLADSQADVRKRLSDAVGEWRKSLPSFNTK